MERETWSEHKARRAEREARTSSRLKEGQAARTGQRGVRRQAHSAGGKDRPRQL